MDSQVSHIEWAWGNIPAEVCAQDISMELSLPIVAATYWLEAADRFAKILKHKQM